jgi:hypothetical protein
MNYDKYEIEANKIHQQIDTILYNLGYTFDGVKYGSNITYGVARSCDDSACNRHYMPDYLYNNEYTNRFIYLVNELYEQLCNASKYCKHENKYKVECRIMWDK